MYSKYERRTDTRTYEDRRKLYEGVSTTTALCNQTHTLVRLAAENSRLVNISLCHVHQDALVSFEVRSDDFE
jgi:hypothetical protein